MHQCRSAGPVRAGHGVPARPFERTRDRRIRKRGRPVPRRICARTGRPAVPPRFAPAGPQGPGSGTLVTALSGGPGPVDRDHGDDLRGDVRVRVSDRSFQPLAPNCWPTAYAYSSPSTIVMDSVRTHGSAVNSFVVRNGLCATRRRLICYATGVRSLAGVLSLEISTHVRRRSSCSRTTTTSCPTARCLTAPPQGVQPPCHNRTD